ncbi:histidinol phosphatase [Flavobacterium sp. IMCC34852]|uniref:protein-tyrosine-phosphatase n=1 Tax=Flavobacterium rivulicola TaxID=2732161 RepID=A0A7Y3VZI5_9FLAO|nr:CpsB/CapC family capsule biosynthesis tyrosine phosphatase [Flavobacterium sp. IMCC34852]NNT72572.1 histidinol phosphatase [Flavobacterium sp. IMCC34852]
MIHFFKPKPYLCDLIPSNHIDIHSHLLPGIDDGAATLEDTTVLIEGLQKLGFTKFITTPHVMGEVWNNKRDQIEEKLQTTTTALKLPNLENNFKAAAEYMIDAEFVDLFKTEKLLTLKENHVLVEISYLNPPIQLYDILFELQIAGYQPVLAHPERYNFYHHPSLVDYKKLKKAGCLFQLNMLSTVGYYGERVAKISDALLKAGLIDFIGSDVHHTRHLEFIQKKIVLKNHGSLPLVFQNNAFFNF